MATALPEEQIATPPAVDTVAPVAMGAPVAPSLSTVNPMAVYTAPNISQIDIQKTCLLGRLITRK